MKKSSVNLHGHNDTKTKFSTFACPITINHEKEKNHKTFPQFLHLNTTPRKSPVYTGLHDSTKLKT